MKNLPKIGSNEWKDWRRERIGASDSATILGISPFKDLYSLCEEKILKKDPFINKAMKRGTDREQEALNWAENELGIDLESRIVIHPEIEWKYATMDGISVLGDVAIEIKWANAKVHAEAKKGKVIDYYYPQVQSQMACCDLEMMYFLSCREEDGVADFCLIEVKRDDRFIKKMIEQETYVYETYILPKIMPEKEGEKETHEKTDDEFMFDILMEQQCKLGEDISFLETLKKQREDIRLQLIELSKGKNIKSSRFKMSKKSVKGTIDYSIIPQLQGVDLESYRKESKEQWKFEEI